MYSTYADSSLQFPDEMNTGGSKTPTTFIPFHTNDDFRGRLLINNELNPCTILCHDDLKHLYHS